MTKKDEMTKEQEDEMIAKRDANRIIAGENITPMDQETASHQYQAGTNAVNTNVLAGYSVKTESIMDKIDTPENLKKREEANKAAIEADKEAAKEDKKDK